MTGPEFAALLARLELSQVALAREIEALTGHKVHKSTFSRMVNEERGVPPFLVAYLRLREQKGPPSI